MKIIEANNISKSYRIYHQAADYGTLRDSIAKVGSYAYKKITGQSEKMSKETFWALKNINFSVEKGEALGVIGANGAGKSTLLKILSRVTAPTEGSITLRGRVAALLEVGTGFHGELTGRENIFLNGAILGMTKREIEKKFDEIVDFSGVEKFIDTPVKRYSSGMNVRLGFAVAAHMEPEILIVDEVLAVGDADFQKRCLGKMDEVSKASGRTILFVSHNMTAIQQLCDRAIFLEKGQIRAVGSSKDMVHEYLQEPLATDSTPVKDRTDRTGNGKVQLEEFAITNHRGEPVISAFDKLKIKSKLNIKEAANDIQFRIAFIDMTGRTLFRVDTDNISLADLQNGEITIETGELNIASTYCFVNIGVFADNILADYIQQVTAIDVISVPKSGVKSYTNDMATILISNRFI